MGVLDRFSLDGKLALVTGGAGPQFGSSVSEALAEAGARLITASRSRDRNEEYADSMRRQGHVRAVQRQPAGLRLAADVEDRPER